MYWLQSWPLAFLPTLCQTRISFSCHLSSLPVPGSMPLSLLGTKHWFARLQTHCHPLFHYHSLRGFALAIARSHYLHPDNLQRLLQDELDAQTGQQSRQLHKLAMQNRQAKLWSDGSSLVQCLGEKEYLTPQRRGKLHWGSGKLNSVSPKSV